MKKVIRLTESELVKIIERVITESDTELDYNQVVFNTNPQLSTLKLSDGTTIKNISVNKYCTTGSFTKDKLPENCIFTITTSDKKSYNCNNQGCTPIDTSRQVDRFDDATGKNQGKTVNPGKLGQSLGRPSQKTRANF